MLRIYGSARSRGVRTLWVAGELGLQYEHLDYAPRSPQTRTPEYLALNPNARVPTIDQDLALLLDLTAARCWRSKTCPRAVAHRPSRALRAPEKAINPRLKKRGAGRDTR